MAQDEHHRMPPHAIPGEQHPSFPPQTCAAIFSSGMDVSLTLHKKIGAQLLKMAAHQAAQLRGDFSFPKAMETLRSSQASITGKNEPGTEAEKLSKNEEEAVTAARCNCRSRAIEKVNDEIEHAGSAVSRASAAG